MSRLMTIVAVLGLSVGVFAQSNFFEDVKCLPDDLFANLKHKVLYLPEVAAAPAPVVDGELNDAIWKEAVHLTDFSDQDTAGKPHDPVEAWVARGSNAIYVAIKAVAKIPEYPQGRVQSAGMHNEDFRILFNPSPARWGRNEFAVRGGSAGWGGILDWIKGVASTNIVYLKDYLYPDWNPEVKAKTICLRRGESVIVELVVPFVTLGVPAPERGAEWAFDISRQYSFEFPIPNSKQFGKQPCNTIWGGFYGASHAQLDRWGRMYFGTAKERATAFRAPIVRAYMDRARYDNSDESGEGFIEILPGSDALASMTLNAELVNAQGKAVAQSKVEKLQSGAIGLYVNLRPLPLGKYEMVGRVSSAGKVIAEARCPFERIAGTNVPVAPMKEISIYLFADTRLRSTSLPVSVGVPFPKGLIKDTASLVLQEARGIPWQPTWHSIPAQFDVRSRWYRNGSLEWVGVSFEAQYLQGTARSYRLLWEGAEKKVEVEKPLSVEETADAIVVTTGPAKFTVLKKRFNLIDSAWLDANGNGQFEEKEQIVKAGSEGGVWYENKTQRLNGAHTNTVVKVAECGPVRAVITAEGWYENNGQKECIQKTRMFFARGSKTVKVLHTWINTVDTRQGGRTREISLKLGVPGVKSYAFGSECGSIYSGDVPQSGIYQIQLNSEKCLIETEIGKAVGDDVRRMGGWLYAGNERGGVSLAGRDLWKLYPKELAVNGNSVGLYLWPVHGREVFSEEEQLKIPRLMQLLSAHQGRELDLQMPKSYYEKLGWYWNQDWEAEKDQKASSFGPFISWKMWRGYNATGQGVATSVEVDMTLHGAGAGAPAARRCAEVLDVNPGGGADPKWTRFTDALGPLHEKDERRFASVEVMMDKRFEDWLNQMDCLDDYGMFNWPDFHQYPYDEFSPTARAFHRCWSNNHYQESRTFFHMFLRSCEGKYWRYATARARHTMDVDSVNYGDDPPVHPYHVRGANYHCKGIIHWGGDGQVSGHYVNYDYMLYQYYLTGDPRGPELARMWADEYARRVWVAEGDRECSGPMDEITYVYHHFRDPRLLKSLNLFKEAMLSAPLAKHHAHWYNYLSWWRVNKYANDPRVEALITALWNDGSPEKKDFGGPMIPAMAFAFTGDRRILAGARVGIGLSRIRTYRFLMPPGDAYFWGETPYLMTAFEQIDATGDVMVSGPGNALWERFWKTDLDKWRTENKLIYGRKP